MKRVPLIGLILLAGVWLVLAITQFVSSTASIAAEGENQNMLAIAESNTAVVNHTLNSRIASLQNLAAMLENAGSGYTSAEAMKLLASFSKTEGYERLAIDYANGTTHTSDGLHFDISQLGYGERIREGKPFVLDVIPALADGTPVVCLMVPLHGPDGYEAALRCALTTAQLSQIFQQTFFTGGGGFVLVDAKGQYAAASTPAPAALAGENYNDDMAALSPTVDTTSPEGSTSSQFHFAGESYQAYHVPVTVDGWQLTTVVPRASLEQRTKAHITNAFVLLVQIVALILIFTLYIYLSERGAKRKALLNEACFKALAAQTGKVILEWDFESGKIVSATNFKELFGREAATQDSAEDALSQAAVMAEDQEAFRSVFATVLSGQPVSDARFRVADQDGIYHWCSLSGIVVKKPNGEPYKAIGSLENIEEQVQKEEQLRRRAEIDALTGLYNRATTEYLIQETLKGRRASDNRYALFIIDVDNFKAVNDKLGHMYGDMVLASLSSMLKKLFRSDDVAGRVGGDEFFVFLKNFHSTHLIQTKAAEICELYRNTYIESGQMVSISASVGISLCPEHGCDLETLYKNADTALYEAKARGKDQYYLYEAPPDGAGPGPEGPPS